MYDGELLSKLLERGNNAPLKEVFGCAAPQERLEKILSLRPYVDRAAYAMFVRISLSKAERQALIQSTADVPSTEGDLPITL